jgi:hypothetical protein
VQQRDIRHSYCDDGMVRKKKEKHWLHHKIEKINRNPIII